MYLSSSFFCWHQISAPAVFLNRISHCRDACIDRRRYYRPTYEETALNPRPYNLLLAVVSPFFIDTAVFCANVRKARTSRRARALLTATVHQNFETRNLTLYIFTHIFMILLARAIFNIRGIMNCQNTEGQMSAEMGINWFVLLLAVLETTIQIELSVLVFSRVEKCPR